MLNAKGNRKAIVLVQTCPSCLHESLRCYKQKKGSRSAKFRPTPGNLLSSAVSQKRLCYSLLQA